MAEGSADKVSKPLSPSPLRVRKINDVNRLDSSCILYCRLAVAFTSYLWLEGHKTLFGESISNIFVLNLLNNALPITASVLTEFSGPFTNHTSVPALFFPPLLGHEICLMSLYVLQKCVNARLKR